MIAAAQPQSRRQAKLLHIDTLGRIRHLPRYALSDLLHAGEVGRHVNVTRPVVDRLRRVGAQRP